MQTRYTVLRPGQEAELHEIDWPRDPSYDKISELVDPLVEGRLEHMFVIVEGEMVDMFVNDEGRRLGLPRNEEATRIYRTMFLSQHPEYPAETLSHIVGPAVLFHRKVWF